MKRVLSWNFTSSHILLDTYICISNTAKKLRERTTSSKKIRAEQSCDLVQINRNLLASLVTEQNIKCAVVVEEVVSVVELLEINHQQQDEEDSNSSFSLRLGRINGASCVVFGHHNIQHLGTCTSINAKPTRPRSQSTRVRA